MKDTDRQGTEKRYGLFFDKEKEAFGWNEDTLFLFYPEKDRIGNVALRELPESGPLESEPRFTLDECKRLALTTGARRIYIGARETEMPVEEIKPWLDTGLSISFETADPHAAYRAQQMHGDCVDVVLGMSKRTFDILYGGIEGFNRSSPSYAVRVMGDGEMTFLKKVPVWGASENTELSGSALEKLLSGSGQ
jgi:hypothetical protein